MNILKLTAGTAVLFLGLAITPTLHIPQVELVADAVVIAARYVDPVQLACMAQNIYHEARNESLLGKAAVARVVVNRINQGFATSPCKVIQQTTKVTQVNDDGEKTTRNICQFSWVCAGVASPNKSNPLYIKSKEVAYQVLAFDKYADVLPGSAVFFHSTSVAPMWAYRQVATIGNHIFYSGSKK